MFLTLIGYDFNFWSTTYMVILQVRKEVKIHYGRVEVYRNGYRELDV